MTGRAQAKATSHDLQVPRRGLAHPLESLVFLLPFLLLYEIGSLRLHTSIAIERQDRVIAYQLLRVFFELFGTTGAWVPALAVAAILLGAQLTSGRPWLVRPRGVLWLYAESLLWAVPLLVLSRLFGLAGHRQAGTGLWSDLVLCVGAGVYEELVFRLILICLIVMIGADLLRLPAGWTSVFAIAASALLFAAHHHLPIGSQEFDLPSFLFRALAGVALGVLFMYRGYGIAAGTHVFYNLAIVALAY
jgi:membrane protease YdiL (CAAX protease family)